MGAGSEERATRVRPWQHVPFASWAEIVRIDENEKVSLLIVDALTCRYAPDFEWQASIATRSPRAISQRELPRRRRACVAKSYIVRHTQHQEHHQYSRLGGTAFATPCFASQRGRSKVLLGESSTGTAFQLSLNGRSFFTISNSDCALDFPQGELRSVGYFASGVFGEALLEVFC